MDEVVLYNYWKNNLLVRKVLFYSFNGSISNA